MGGRHTTRDTRRFPEALRPASRRALLVAWALLAGALSAGPAHAHPNSSDDPEGRILGGTRVSISQAPWMVYLHTGIPLPHCGGVLVAPSTVLTAAHCVTDVPPSALTVVAGREDILLPTGISTAINRVTVHPDYNPATHHNDLALLHLTTPLPGPPLPLPRPSDATLHQPGTPARIYGWGVTAQHRPPAQYLHTADLAVSPESSCMAVFGPLIYDPARMLCAGTGQATGTCQGDSGGPLIIAGRLAGITSYGGDVPCGQPGGPEVYTRITHYSNEILDQLE